jgi:hypothetical protein
MTKKPGPDVPSLVVAANAEPKRGVRLAVAARAPSKARPAATRSGNRAFVAVEDVLFAGMGKRVLAGVFTDAEIERLATLFGLSADEVAELYRPADLRPVAATAPRRRRVRSTPAG